MTAERQRLADATERRAHWKRWGPYVSERAWGTVREDYSADGDPWNYFPHDHARSRAFRWNEDGLAGLCDRHQHICFALALWNRRDPFLKERLFGLSNHEGNHGEDVKECYFFLDNTPTHSYMKCLYKYPQQAFPYEALIRENGRRTRRDPEFELLDTGIFDGDRYFDVFVEYAKASPEDVLARITVENRGPDAAPLDVLPTIWFRNQWSWKPGAVRPSLTRIDGLPHRAVEISDPVYGRRYLYAEGEPDLLFTENDTNRRRLFGAPNETLFVKDGINAYVVDGDVNAVNAQGTGTKAAARYAREIEPGGRAVLRLRLTDRPPADLATPFDEAFDRVFADRLREADEFYAEVIPPSLAPDARDVMRQAFAGLLWTKQFYHYVVREWLDGDPGQPPPPRSRRRARNREWIQLYNSDVISMPDTWEYPWYASWDLAFHCVPLALIDAQFAKEQLVLFLREWYLHPNGQLPAYEWNFSDVNPPVHAWAAWRVYKIDRRRSGKADRPFLERVFHKLLLNFTWWVNRKDTEGNNIFEGGFLGLDNIGVFDRSAPIPLGGHLEQSDTTSWMAMYTLNMLAMAIELAMDDGVYEDIASKFLEHFLYIAHAMGSHGDASLRLWDEEDGFFYDVLQTPDGARRELKVHSIVGLIPLLAVETLEPRVLERLPGFRTRLEWFLIHRPDLTENIASVKVKGHADRRLLAIADADQLRRILRVMLDEREFLSPHGVRSLSRRHDDHPYVLTLDGHEHVVDYEPAESTTPLFGGNSNWRGPVWFPGNFLLIEALQRYHHYFGDAFTVECPTGSGRMMTLWQVAGELSRRLSSLFLPGPDGARPAHGRIERFRTDPHWRTLVLFHEYFHGDTGEGLGASHQTGWTALVAKLLQQSGRSLGV
ncbi:MAG: glucosidase [Acidobacteria bacterium]|nr:MAG: glucosidase [Acidobacteriota bacterium]